MPTHDQLENALRLAQDYVLMRAYEGDSEADAVRQAIDQALRAGTDTPCPTCGDAVPYSGVGRPPVYCGAPCRYRAYRQRARG